MAQRNESIKKAVGILKELSQDEETRLIYEAREKAWRDERSRMSGAYDKGKLEGILEGKLEIVQNALRFKMPIEQIAELTGLSVEEIRKVANQRI